VRTAQARKGAKGPFEVGLSEEQVAARLVGKTLYVMFKAPTSPGGKSVIIEDTHRVAKFRRILEPNEGGEARGRNPSETSRKKRLLQFYAVNGGMRTVAISNIVDVY